MSEELEPVKKPTIPTECKRARAGDSPPHRIIVLPEEVTSVGFKRPSVPTVLCSRCDGGVHVAAIREHDRRMADSAT